jgi:hypothetical protein
LSDGIAYVDKCNSLHVYERDYDDFKRTLSKLKQEQGTAWDSTDPKSLAMFQRRELFWAVKEAKKSVLDPVFKRST